MNLTKEEAEVIEEELDILLLVNPPIFDERYPWTGREALLLKLIKEKFNIEIRTLVRGTYGFNILLKYLLRDGLIGRERYEEEYEEPE